jgi:hypothetical protein
MGLEPQGGRPDPKAGGEGGAGPSPSKGAGQGGQAHDAKEFDETKHPRAPDGKFGKGSGSSSGGQMGAGEAGSEGEKKQAGEVDKPGREPQMGGNSNGKKRQQSQASKLFSGTPHPPEKLKAEADRIVAKFPGGPEAVAATLAKVRAAKPTNNLVEDGGFRVKDPSSPTGYSYTPERQKEHARIVNEIFSDERVMAAMPKDGENPVTIMLGGRGGSGKGWITDKGPLKSIAIDPKHPIPEGMKNGAIVLDADAIKTMLPEFEGWNASPLHEESSDILELIDEKARELGVNVILDATMKSEGSVAQRTAAYKANGSEIEGYYMHLPPEEAALRAMSRYQNPKGGGKFDGRFVPPEIILGNVNNEKNFDKLSQHFRKWAVYENTGKEPRLVESSHDD